jgi:hypothetical protein
MALLKQSYGTPRRAIRIANCSGAKGDPGVHMLNQALYGNVDVITGDYLAEMNLAQNAEAMKMGTHPGYEPTALDGLTLSLEVLNKKRIKVVITGGGLCPKALAEETSKMVKEKKLNLKVAYVSGDDLLETHYDLVTSEKGLRHLDGDKDYISKSIHEKFLKDPKKSIVTAHAYLGARAITRGLREGADIIICAALLCLVFCRPKLTERRWTSFRCFPSHWCGTMVAWLERNCV